MKKKKLSIYMIMLISLLSCNTSDPNELTRKKIARQERENFRIFRENSSR